MGDPYWLPEPAMDGWANVAAWSCIVAVVLGGAALDTLKEEEDTDAPD